MNEELIQRQEQMQQELLRQQEAQTHILNQLSQTQRVDKSLTEDVQSIMIDTTSMYLCCILVIRIHIINKLINLISIVYF